MEENDIKGFFTILMTLALPLRASLTDPLNAFANQWKSGFTELSYN